MLPSLSDYEHLVYTLQETYPSVERSTLVVIRLGPTIAELNGSLEFKDDISMFSLISSITACLLLA